MGSHDLCGSSLGFFSTVITSDLYLEQKERIIGTLHEQAAAVLLRSNRFISADPSRPQGRPSEILTYQAVYGFLEQLGRPLIRDRAKVWVF